MLPPAGSQAFHLGLLDTAGLHHVCVAAVKDQRYATCRYSMDRSIPVATGRRAARCRRRQRQRAAAAGQAGAGLDPGPGVGKSWIKVRVRIKVRIRVWVVAGDEVPGMRRDQAVRAGDRCRAMRNRSGG